MSNKRSLVNIGAFSLLGIVLAGGVYYNFFTPDSAESKIEAPAAKEEAGPVTVVLSEEQLKKLSLEIRSAEPGELEMIISTRGKIIPHPDKIVHILPNVSGIAVESKKKIGDQVSEGEVLAVLESQDMAIMKAEFLATKSKEKLAGTILDREKSLYQKQISSEQDYLNALSSFEEAQINARLALQKLYALGLSEQDIQKLYNESNGDLRFYSITSPMNGVVTHRHLTKGEYVDSEAPIFELADFNTLWVEIGVYPQNFDRIKAGQIVQIALPIGDKTAQAKIIYLRPIIDGDSITAQAVAELDNSNGDWFPGSFVKVEITTDKFPAQLIVPKTAVQNIEGKDCIFLCNDQGFEKRVVKLGRSDNDNIEIVSGMNEGDRFANQPFILKADLGKNSVEEDD